MTRTAFQDQIVGNHCWGCGSLNMWGLAIKSYWDGEESVCEWEPRDRFMSGPSGVLNGGIIATLVDCHSICTAIAARYRLEGREIGSGESVKYATGSLNVRYLAPTPINQTVSLRATIVEATDRKTVVNSTVSSGGQERAIGEVVGVRVPEEWGD